jgi:hypothetical protein
MLSNRVLLRLGYRFRFFNFSLNFRVSLYFFLGITLVLLRIKENAVISLRLA